MYRPPHQRKASEVRKDFRKEFPELCAKPILPTPMSFAHIKDIEPEPVTSLPKGWISLKDPANYRKPVVYSEQSIFSTIDKMEERWNKNEHYQNYIDQYPMEFSEESEEDPELSSLEATDPDYESDF